MYEKIKSGVGEWIMFFTSTRKMFGCVYQQGIPDEPRNAISMAIHKLLIPEWPFRGEVLLIEQNKNNGILEKHTVKDWTYIKYEIEGKKSDDKYHLVPPSHFDHDIFFILRKLIAKPPVDMSIIPNQ